jgi:hypothetical protein
MEDSFRNLVIGSIMAMLFVFAMFSFFISVGNEYGKDTTELTGDYYDFSDINQSLSETQAEAERLREIVSSSSGSGGVLSYVERFFDGVGAFFGVSFSMFGFIIDLFDLIILGTMNIIFANAIITGTIIAIVILLALFGIFRFLKQGS